MRTTRSLLAPALLAVSLALPLAACGGGGGGDASDDVASLGGDATTTTSGGGGGRGGGPGQNPEFEDAMLEFARCMRDHGIDFPDPQANGDGMIVVGGGVGGPGGQRPSEADMERMEDAQEACQPILDEVQSQMPQPDPEQLEEMRENALEFAQCMREHGVDMPDPVFDDSGAIGIQIGPSDDGPSTGPAFDPNDEDFQAAQEACGGPGGGFVTAGDSAVDDGDGGDG
jgi:hypothetical protein